ncbi:hypothetical protein ACOSQ3_012832 [Xanthoceras sorbifolium]
MRSRSCSSNLRRCRSRRRVKLSLVIKNSKTSHNSTRRQLKQLLGIIPGCHGMNMDIDMFQRIADYIILLQAKVGLLQNLSSLYGV